MASSSVADRSSVSMKRRLTASLAATLLAAGVWHGAGGVWLYAKAALAQQLIAQAWVEQQRGGMPTKPWPWSDTYPVARLSWPRGEVDQIVLAGMQGEALAFGPGLVSGEGIVIAGHRDTHFRFLAELQIGDELLLQRRDGLQHYRVESLRIVDSSVEPLLIDSDELVLVTCYPFDAIRAGGPLRYRVSARPLPSSIAAAKQSSPMTKRFSL